MRGLPAGSSHDRLGYLKPVEGADVKYRHQRPLARRVRKRGHWRNQFSVLTGKICAASATR